MFDEMDRLRTSPHLLELLSHYANHGEANREAWQRRLMQMDGADACHLTKLHGEMIAFGWVEQNTGEIPACYRITPAGLRAARLSQTQKADDEDSTLPEGQNQAA